MSWITSLAAGLIVPGALFVFVLVAINNEAAVERRLVEGERRSRTKRVAKQMKRVRRHYPKVDGELRATRRPERPLIGNRDSGESGGRRGGRP
jgi:hypothetical protein